MIEQLGKNLDLKTLQKKEFLFWSNLQACLANRVLKAQISVKTLMLVQTPILKLRLDYFYFNLNKAQNKSKYAQ